MPDEKMELSPKVDIDLNETTLSFISSLTCKDDDSVLLPEAMNSESCTAIDANELLKSGIIDPNQDLFNISFDKTGLTSEQTEGIINTLTTMDGAKDSTDLNINDPNLNSNIVQSSFITTASPLKTVEIATPKSNVINTNKPGATQLLIFQKPTSTMLVGAKTVPTVSSSNVAIVQTSTGASSGTKFLTLPTLNASGNLISTVNPSSSGKTNDVKILLSQGPTSNPTFVTAKPMVSVNATNTSSPLQAPLKRAVTPSSSGQMVTKVIITNNATSNQTLITPVPVSSTSTSSVQNSQPQSILLTSPNKTFTLSRNNVFNLNNSHQILRPILGTPAKQYVLSPVRAYQKPVPQPATTYSKSPRRIAPATNSTISSVNTGPRLATIMCPPNMTTLSTAKTSVSQSPTKVIIKPVSQTLLKPIISVSSASSVTTTLTNVACSSTVQQSILPITTVSSQPIQVPGSKFHYVRLVSAPTTSTTTTTGRKETTILPVSSSTAALATTVVAVTTASVSTSVSQVRPAVPIAPAKLVSIAPKASEPAKLVTSKQVSSKFLIPAVSSSQIRGTTSVSATQIGQLPAGTFIPVGGNSSSYVVVPAQYVTQLQQNTSSSGTATQMLNILPAPATPSSSSLGSQSAFISLTSNPPNNFRSSSVPPSHQSAHHSPRRATPVEIDNRQRKPCNCTKSQCLKLYCDCFANGEFCNSCNCNNCYNNLAHEEERQKAIKACLDRNPLAFHPKIGKSREGDQERRHTKGCNCKRSYCLKNYCECYEAKILCTSICKCVGCKNFEDSSERKTLMHLADAAEVRVQQQAAAKTNFSSDIFDFPTKPPVMSRSGERLPFAFVTDDVLEATCLCLLATANDAEKSHASEEEIERLVMLEFGRCLKRIIECANKTKVSKMDVQ
ncbi:protein lin-54 homolog isoform X1 [Argiope bruennichi]|uniref:protein lin-54 homolog isoform X1 n=1 Tax=Argiope bruennichi TaxID=94029 RepID=UPI0024955E2C|nr:protein lin-54 homolog isoform X1 [Argiope bruennichi]